MSCETEIVSMKQTADGKYEITVGNQSKTFSNYVKAAEWAESLIHESAGVKRDDK